MTNQRSLICWCVAILLATASLFAESSGVADALGTHEYEVFDDVMPAGSDGYFSLAAVESSPTEVPPWAFEIVAGRPYFHVLSGRFVLFSRDNAGGETVRLVYRDGVVYSPEGDVLVDHGPDEFGDARIVMAQDCAGSGCWSVTLLGLYPGGVTDGDWLVWDDQRDVFELKFPSDH